MGQTHPDAHTKQPTRERRGTTERRCSRATATASPRQNRALTSDEIVTPARPPSRPLTRTQSASTATHGPLPARPDAAGPLPVSPRRAVTVRDPPNSLHCAPKTARIGVPTSIVTIRGPQSTHPPLTGRRYRARHNRSNIRPSTSRAAISLERSHDRPRAAKSTRWLAVRSRRAHHRRQAGLKSAPPSRARAPKGDLRKRTREAEICRRRVKTGHLRRLKSGPPERVRWSAEPGLVCAERAREDRGGRSGAVGGDPAAALRRGVSIREIHRRTGLHRDTIRRAMRER